MALDSATKRRSMLAMGVLALIVHPVPDGTIAAIDQKHFLGLPAAVATQTGLTTSNLNIISTGIVEPNHVSDSLNNLLIAGQLEVQDDGYFDGDITTSGRIRTTGGDPEKTGTFFTGSSGNTVLSFSGDNFDIRAGAGGASSQNVIRITSAKNVGIGKITPTLLLSVLEKSGHTTIGGFAVKLTNKTGANSVAGELVEAHQATADAIKLSATNSSITIGVFLESGVADAAEAWIVVSGIADVKYDAAGASIGDWIKASGTAGRAASSGSEVPGANHFREIGHAIEDAAANALGRIIMHFN